MHYLILPTFLFSLAVFPISYAKDCECECELSDQAALDENNVQELKEELTELRNEEAEMKKALLEVADEIATIEGELKQLNANQTSETTSSN